MKYRPLPIETEITALPEDQRATAVRAYLDETVRTKGFQIVLGVLRGLEEQSMDCLRTERGNPVTWAARLACVHEIRQALTSLLPVGEAAAAVDWYDDVAEPSLTGE